MAGPNTSLNSLLDFIGTGIQSVRDAEIAQKEVAQANERSSMQVLNAQLAITEAERVIETEKVAGLKAAEEAKKQLQQTAGGVDALTNIVKQTHDKGKEVVALTDEVVRARNRNILDLFSDPVGTLKDIVTLSSKETKLEGAVLQGEMLLKTGQQRHQTLTQGFQEIDNTKTTITAASLAALNSKSEAVRQQLSAEADIKARSYGLQAVQAGLQASEQTIRYMGVARNAVKEEQAFEMQKAQFRMAQEAARRDAARLEMALRAEKRDLAKQAEADAEVNTYIQYMKDGAAALGVNIGTDAATIKVFLRRAQNPNTLEAKILERGMANSATGSTSRVASSPSDAYELFSKYPIPGNESMAPTMAVFQKARALLEEESKKTGSKVPDIKKDPSGWAIAFDTKVQELVAQDFALIRPDSAFNVAPVLKDIVQNTPALQNLAFTQKVLSPLTQANQFPQDHRALVRIGIDEMKKGNITSDQLVNGVTQIYTSAAMTKTNQLRYGDFGITVPKLGAQYRVELDGEVYDLTKREDVLRYTARTQSASNFVRSALSQAKPPIIPAYKLVTEGLKGASNWLEGKQ